MLRKPLRHQSEGLAYAKGRSRLALFWQMRLGKSLVAVRWAKDYPGAKLIVCPLTTMIAWERELELERVKCTALIGSTPQKIKLLDEKWESCDWFLVNPEGLRAANKIATHYPWSVVIADESTFMANPRAQITKLMRKGFDTADAKCVLTGEPCPEGPQQIVEPMLWLYGSFMNCRNYWEWQIRYMGRGAYGFVPTVRTETETKKAAHARASFLRAQDVGLFMPKVFETRECVLPTAVKRLYDEMEREWVIGELSTIYTIVRDGWLGQLAAGVVPRKYKEDATFVSDHKSRELIALMKGELSRQQVLIWSRHTREIMMHKRKLIEAGFNVASITGAVSKQGRANRLAKFRAGDLDALICQQRCAQYGMDMSFCDVMIYTSNYWDWIVRAQCDERTSHPNKKTPSLIIDLVSKDTIETDVVATLHGKKISSRHFMEKLRESTRIRRLVGRVRR